MLCIEANKCVKCDFARWLCKQSAIDYFKKRIFNHMSIEMSCLINLIKIDLSIKNDITMPNN